MDAPDESPGQQPWDVRRKPRLATAEERFRAAAYDGVLLACPLFPLFGASSDPATPLHVRVCILAGTVVLIWLYFAIMECWPTQATIGKLAINLRVTDLEGNAISFPQAVIRQFSKLLYLRWCFSEPAANSTADDGLTIHERVSKTVVVHSIWESGYRRRVPQGIDMSRISRGPHEAGSANHTEGIEPVPDQVRELPSPAPYDDLAEDEQRRETNGGTW